VDWALTALTLMDANNSPPVALGSDFFQLTPAARHHIADLNVGATMILTATRSHSSVQCNEFQWTRPRDQRDADYSFLQIR